MPPRFGLVEERIDYLSDGRVCGVDIVMDKSGGHYPFFGTWTLDGDDLVEDFARGRPPIGVQAQRRRKIVQGVRLAALGVVRLDGPWPNRYERADASEAARFGFLDDERSLVVADLPGWCFRVADPPPAAQER